MSVRPILGVIPARGGSKGLPGKNIRPLAGLPLLRHSIEFAKLCPEIDTLIVSTDSEEIAEVGREGGALVPFLRPAELSRDDTPMMPVLKHALLETEKAQGREFSSVLLLDPTSPGRLPSHLQMAITKLESDSSADGVCACSTAGFNPYFVGVVESEGYMKSAIVQSEGFGRRQDVPKFLRINGSLYLWRRLFILRSSAQWSRDGKHKVIEMPREYSFSIDDEYEFRIADFVFSTRLINVPWLK